ncbi:MAG: hypothetical protein AB9917_13315 [Negativicutes bacterium]
MRTIAKKVAQCLTDVGSACPYTMVGKKVVQSVRGKRVIPNTVDSAKEGELKARMKTGRNVALIGFFCPIFWISLFTGASAGELYFNAAHSGIVVVIGLSLMLKAKRDFNKKQ